jgi:hypothetical protein
LEFTTTAEAKKVFKVGKIFFILKTRFAIWCIVNFYSAGVVTQGRRIGLPQRPYLS